MDIVQTQIRVAGGASLVELGLGSQEMVPPINGFALQCRVTSEDAAQNFQVRRLPSAGCGPHGWRLMNAY